MKKRINTTFMTLVMLLFGYSTIVVAQSSNVVSSGFPELDEWVSKCKVERPNALGYPGNYDGKLDSFYAWYAENKMENVLINNAGDPFENPSALSSLKFEREVIESFAPLYGFDLDNVWGLVTMSGTDGNNHGLYFGVNYLKKKTGKMPIAYVSDEAHYSNYRLCDVQNLEVRMIKSNEMGQMIPEEFEKVLDPTRPCLMIYAMGSTFKGAIDNQLELNKILDKYPEMEVYRHIDAACLEAIFHSPNTRCSSTKRLPTISQYPSAGTSSSVSTAPADCLSPLAKYMTTKHPSTWHISTPICV